MKPDIHPNYRFVVIRDISSGFEILTKSTVATRETATIDGVDYPCLQVDVSSDTHPFYTGNQKLMDTAGRVDKYYKKYGFQRDNANG
jgi:large subunit ribosomal protein L31